MVFGVTACFPFDLSAFFFLDAEKSSNKHSKSWIKVNDLETYAISLSTIFLSSSLSMMLFSSASEPSSLKSESSTTSSSLVWSSSSSSSSSASLSTKLKKENAVRRRSAEESDRLTQICLQPSAWMQPLPWKLPSLACPFKKLEQKLWVIRQRKDVQDALQWYLIFSQQHLWSGLYKYLRIPIGFFFTWATCTWSDEIEISHSFFFDVVFTAASSSELRSSITLDLDLELLR